MLGTIAMKGNGVRIYIRYPNCLYSNAYQAVIDEGLQDTYLDNSVFIQDGVICHTSRSTIEHLENGRFCLLNFWSLLFINIIKNMWFIWKRNISRYNIKSCTELWNYPKGMKRNTDRSNQSTSRRLRAVVKARE